MNFATLKKIFIWWGLTIPVALIASLIVTAILMNLM